MPAPIIPFRIRPEAYPPTFEPGQVVRNVGEGSRDGARYFAGTVRQMSCGSWVANLQSIRNGVVQEYASEHYSRYFDPCNDAESLTIAAAQRRDMAERIVKGSKTNHKIGVPKGRLP